MSETHYTTPTAKPLLREYIYHPDATTPTAFVESGRLYVLQADVRGAVTHVFDAGGQVVWQAHYSAFGQATLSIDRIRQPFRLSGQQEDVESGLYYNLARYYAPFIGAYLSLDPEWLDPDTYYYAYARQDPYNRHDPLGNIAPLLIAIGGAAIVGGVIGGVTAAMNGGGWRAIAGGVAHGALSGAGAAVGAIAGFAVGGPVGAWAGGVAGAGVGGFLGTLAEQLIKGDALCFGCAAKEALEEMAWAAALGVAGKLLGKIAGPLLGRLANTRLGKSMAGTFKRAVNDVRRWVVKKGGNRLRRKLWPVKAKKPVVVARLPKYQTRPPFKKNPNHDQAEFERQIKGQQDGLNNMTVDEYLNNSDSYKKIGRAKSGAKAQEEARKKAINRKIEELEAKGKSHKDAKKEAENWADTQNALHNPDQIAGGHADKIEGMGDAGVNKSIGSQWEKRGTAKNMDDYIREKAKNMTPEERKNTKLDVELDY